MNLKHHPADQAFAPFGVLFFTLTLLAFPCIAHAQHAYTHDLTTQEGLSAWCDINYEARNYESPEACEESEIYSYKVIGFYYNWFEDSDNVGKTIRWCSRTYDLRDLEGWTGVSTCLHDQLFAETIMDYYQSQFSHIDPEGQLQALRGICSLSSYGRVEQLACIQKEIFEVAGASDWPGAVPQ